LQAFRDVEIALQRRRLDDGRLVGENLAGLLGDRYVDLEARLYEDQPDVVAWPSAKGTT
jgi:hypothetical protein